MGFDSPPTTYTVFGAPGGSRHRAFNEATQSCQYVRRVRPVRLRPPNTLIHVARDRSAYLSPTTYWLPCCAGQGSTPQLWTLSPIPPKAMTETETEVEKPQFPLMTPTEIRLLRAELNPAAKQGLKALRRFARLARDNPVVKRDEFNAATHFLNELVRNNLVVPTEQTDRLKADLIRVTEDLIRYRDGFWYLIKALNQAKKGAPSIGTEVMLRLPKDLLDRLPDHKARAESAQPDDAPTHSPTRPEVARQYGILNPEAAR